MKTSIRQRLEKMADRFEEVGRMLAAPDLAGGSPQFRDLSMEYAKLEPLADRFRQFRELERERSAAEEMLSDADSQMRALGEEEVARLVPLLSGEEMELALLLIPKDPRDERNIFLEVRAGTGGDEAAIFA